MMDMGSSAMMVSGMDHQVLAGPFLGNIVVLILAGAITIVVIALALRMLFVPGERDPNHPKYRVLRPDR